MDLHQCPYGDRSANSSLSILRGLIVLRVNADHWRKCSSMRYDIVQGFDIVEQELRCLGAGVEPFPNLEGFGSMGCNVLQALKKRREIEPEPQGFALMRIVPAKPLLVRAVPADQKTQFLKDCGMPSDRPVRNPVATKRERQVGGKDGVMVSLWRQAGQHGVKRGDHRRLEAHQWRRISQRVDDEMPLWNRIVRGQYLVVPRPKGGGCLSECHGFITTTGRENPRSHSILEKRP